MLRKYLPVLASTALFIAFGIGFALLWSAATGHTDTPTWLGVILVAVAAFIADLIEQAIRALRARRARTRPARHRKAV